jgi:hypothetical protein
MAAHDQAELKWSATDTLLTTAVTRLTTLGQVVPIPAGRVSASSRWAVENVNQSRNYVNPQVQLTWTCASVPASPLTELTRPTGYLLPLSAFGSPWQDAIVVRPNFQHGLLWFEVRGRPHDATRVKLTSIAGRSAFEVDLLGVHATGEIWMQANQLKFRLVSGSAQGIPLIPFTRTLAKY